MGHIAHLRKQFKSLNKYDYIITLIKRRKKKVLWEIIGSSFEEIWIPFTQGWTSSMYFRYFRIISPWKRAGPFIWTNLNPLHPRMPCAKFGWNWLSGFGEEVFKFRQCIFSISEFSPFGKGGGLHLNKLESPSPKDALCQVWLKLAQWFLRRSFFISSMYFRYFVIISPC